MLVKNVFSQSLNEFVTELQRKPSEKSDQSSNQNSYSEKLETLVYNAIRSTTIIIPPGGIIVVTSTGPATNAVPVTSFIIE